MEAGSTEDAPLRLTVRQPFALASSLLSGQAHRWRRDEGIDPSDGGGWLSGVVLGNFLKIREKIRGQRVGTAETPSVVEFRSVPNSDADYLKPLLRNYFRLDDDIDGIYDEITGDPRVASVVSQYRGLRLLRVEPWECLISFICSANSNLSRIHDNIETISQNFGRPMTLDGHRRYSFPTAERLAEAGEAALRALKLGFRAPYVAQAAETVARGELDLEALRVMPYLQAKERLMELPGVGSKIADCVLLHSLDKLEAFPIDVWVRRALVEWYYSGSKPPPDREMLEWAQAHFGPYAGYAELYLFHGRRLGGRNYSMP